MDTLDTRILYQTTLTKPEQRQIEQAWGDVATLPRFALGVAAICAARGYALPERFAATVNGRQLTISQTI